MAKKVLGSVAVLVAVFLLVVSTRPATFHVERSIDIAAPAAQVYSLIEDFHQWPTWSPYEGRDPNMTRTYGGAPHGVGATYGWSGNREVGEGSMTITQAEPSQRVAVELVFTRPFVGTNSVNFTLKTESPNSCRVTWAMDGDNTFFGKLVSVFSSMDALLGGDFEAGLMRLKVVSQAR